MTDETTEPDFKTKEEWLRQELRASRALLVNLMQWGVAILAAVEVSLYYVRQDATAHLRDLGRLNADELLPILWWSIGALFLFMLAYIFARYTDRVAKHHAHYRAQLVSMTPTYSSIAESIPVGGSLHQAHSYLFYAFPCFDLATWVLFYAGEQMGGRFIPW